VETDISGRQWIYSGGGPLILLDQLWLNEWQGHDLDQYERGQETDYDRACNIEGYLGLLPVGAEYGLVLNDEPMSTTWWLTETTGNIMLVRWVYAENAVAVTGAMKEPIAVTWIATGIVFTATAGQVILFDSAYAGEKIEESLPIPLTAGSYMVETAEYEPDAKTALVLHRFIPVPAK